MDVTLKPCCLYWILSPTKRVDSLASSLLALGHHSPLVLAATHAVIAHVCLPGLHAVMSSTALQTGSGKTHTMLGTEGDPGVIPRAMEQVFASSKALEAKGWTFEMRVG